jgi:hypothetical protein
LLLLRLFVLTWELSFWDSCVSGMFVRHIVSVVSD